MRDASLCCCALVASSLLAIGAVNAQLRGHGGPVRGLAVSPDGKMLMSGSFDTSAIRWSLARSAAEDVLRFHDGAVNAVVLLKDGGAATGGEDARIAIWNPGERMPRTVLEGHQAPVVALAVSGDGRFLASASWDHTARLWPVGGGAPRLLAGHSQNVNGVAFTPDGRAVVTAGYDATLRIWPLPGDDTPLIAVLPTPLNALGIAPAGEIVTAGGRAVDGGGGGGIDDPLAGYAGDPGAEVFRACMACHALGPDGGNRAGPTLAGLFGRRIATLPGYNFSAALKALDIVWTPETVSRLFEIGPAAFTPGTKMPEQRIGSAGDRAALVHFLATATAR